MSRVAETVIERFDEKGDRPPVCPGCLSAKAVVKAGSRKTKTRGMVQRYQCKGCNKLFTTGPLPRAKYPPKAVAFALSYYNQGHTFEETKNTIKRKLKVTVPLPTVSAWVRRHEKLCTFVPLRKRYDLNPRTVIRTKKLHHQQVYEFKYHDLKTNIAAKTFPRIRTYIRDVADTDTRKQPANRNTAKIFRDSTLRCSTYRPPDMPNIQTKTILQNNATKMTKLALTLAKNRSQRHEAIESFFIANDSSTIAVEVPVYILPNEAPDLRLSEPLTGHIDILQFRNKKIQILDYKPDQNPKLASKQLYLYKRALSVRARIPQDRIQTAAFNEDRYVEFKGRSSGPSTPVTTFTSAGPGETK